MSRQKKEKLLGKDKKNKREKYFFCFGEEISYLPHREEITLFSSCRKEYLIVHLGILTLVFIQLHLTSLF